MREVRNGASEVRVFGKREVVASVVRNNQNDGYDKGVVFWFWSHKRVPDIFSSSAECCTCFGSAIPLAVELFVHLRQPRGIMPTYDTGNQVPAQRNTREVTPVYHTVASVSVWMWKVHGRNSIP